MAASRILELILKVSNQASAEIQKLKAELKGIGGAIEISLNFDKVRDEIKSLTQDLQKLSQQTSVGGQARPRTQKTDEERERIAQEKESARQAREQEKQQIRQEKDQEKEKVAQEKLKARQERDQERERIAQEKESARQAKEQEKERVAQEKQRIRQEREQEKERIDQEKLKARQEREQEKERIAQEKLKARQERDQSKVGQGTEKTRESIGGWTQAIGEAAFAFNNVADAVGVVFQAVQQVGGAIYNTLLAGVEQFNARVLSSQTNLAGASRIFVEGVEQIDPTKKIQASAGFVRDLLKQVERDTEELVGVTSSQVAGITDILLRSSGQIQGQFDTTKTTFKDALAALTKGFAAELKVSGIGFFQANQEISSIFRGAITEDSLIAKKLGLDNASIAKLKGQGRLVEEIINRLQGSVAGNAIAAETSISGPLSNIQDFFERLSRTAGEPLFTPIVAGLNQVFKSLKANEDQIFGPITDISKRSGQIFSDLLQSIGQGAASIGERLKPALLAFGETFNQIGQSIGTFFDDGVGKQIAALAGSLTDLAINALPLVAKGFTGLVAAIDFLLDTPIAEFITGSILVPLKLLADVISSSLSNINQLIDARNLGDLLEGTEAASTVTGLLADESLRYANELKLLNELEKQNGKLTEEQIARRNQLRNLSGQTIADIDDQISSLRSLKSNDEALNNAIDVQIGLLTTRKNLLAGQSAENITFEANAIEKLGTSYEQLARKAEEAQRFLNAGGTRENAREFQRSASELIKTTQQQVELGQISREEAEKRLEQIRQNATVEVNTQQSAQDAIQKIRKQTLDQETKELDAQISLIEASARNGQKSQLEAAEEVTRIKRQQLDLQFADLTQAIAAEQEAIAQGTGSKTRLTELQRQQKTLTAQRIQSEVEGETKIQAERIKQIDLAETELTTKIKAAEIQRQADLQQLINQGLITREEANQRRLASTRTTLEAELAAERQSLAALEKLPTGATPALERERQQQIQQAKQKTAEISLRIAENEKAQQEALTRAIQARIDKELQGYKNLQQAAQNSLESQRSLISASKELTDALSAATQSRFDIAIGALESQFSEEDRLRESAQKRLDLLQKIQQAQSPEEVSAAQRELAELDRLEARQKQIQSLKIEAKQAELAQLDQQIVLENELLSLKQKQAEIDAQVGLAESKASLAKLQADREATAEQKRAAELQVQASQQRVDGLKLIQEIERKIAKTQQDTKRLSAQAELARLTPGSQDDAIAARQALTDARSAATESISVSIPGEEIQNAFDPAARALIDAAGTQQSAAIANQQAASSLQSAATQQTAATRQSSKTEDLKNAEIFDQEKATQFTAALDTVRRNISENPIFKDDFDKQLIEAVKLASRSLTGSTQDQLTLRALSEAGFGQAVDVAVSRRAAQKQQLGGQSAATGFLSGIQRETNTFEFGGFRSFFQLGLGEMSQQIAQQTSQFEKVAATINRLAQTAAVPKNVSFTNIRDPIGTAAELYAGIGRNQAIASGF